MYESWKNLKTVDQVLKGRKIEFHNDLPRVDGEMFLGLNFVIKGVKMVPNWDGKFGISDFYLCWVEYESEGKLQDATTILPGQACFKMIKRLVEAHAFPVLCRLNMVDNKDGSQQYYVLDKPEMEPSSVTV